MSRLSDLESRVTGLGSLVSSLGSLISGLGSQIVGRKVSGLGSRISGLESWLSGRRVSPTASHCAACCAASGLQRMLHVHGHVQYTRSSHGSSARLAAMGSWRGSTACVSSYSRLVFGLGIPTATPTGRIHHGIHHGIHRDPRGHADGTVQCTVLYLCRYRTRGRGTNLNLHDRKLKYSCTACTTG